MTLSVCTFKPQAFYELLTLQKISSRAGHSTRSGIDRVEHFAVAFLCFAKSQEIHKLSYR